MRLDAVDPEVLDVRGGTPLRIEGSFPAAAPVRVRLRAGANSRWAYGGVAGSGQRVQVFGSSFVVISPSWIDVAEVKEVSLRVELADDPTEGVDWPAPITVAPPAYADHTFALRSLYPPIDATGPRSLEAARTEAPPLPGALLAPLLDAFGEAFSAFGGTRSTWLLQPADAGAAQVEVAGTAGMLPSGQVLLGGEVYAYSGRTAASLLGLRARGADDDGLRAGAPAGTALTDISPLARQLGALHEAYFLDSAQGIDLSTCGRNLGLSRDPSIRSDATYAAACRAIAYGPRGTLLGLRTALDAMVGAGNYRLREDTQAFPCRVFVDLPQSLTLAQQTTGRTYPGGAQAIQPSDATTLPLPTIAYGLSRVALPDTDDVQGGNGQRLAPPWDYLGADEGAEVAVHNTPPEPLALSFAAGADAYALPLFDDEEAEVCLSACLRLRTGGQAGDSGILLALRLGGQSAGLRLSQSADGRLSLQPCDAAGAALDAAALSWPAGRMVEAQVRRSGDGVWTLRAGRQGVRVTPRTAAGAAQAILGRIAAPAAGTPVADVGTVRLAFRPGRNFAEARGRDALADDSAPQDILLEQPLAGRLRPGTRLRLGPSRVAIRAPGRSTGPAGSNAGSFEVVSSQGADTLRLRRFARRDAVLGSASAAVNQMDLPEAALRYPEDIGRQVQVQGTGSNAGIYRIADLLDELGQVCTLPYPRACPGARLLRGDGSVPDFVAQAGAAIEVQPVFADEAGLTWRVGQGFDLSTTDTDASVELYQPLPDASRPYAVTYYDHPGDTVVDAVAPVVVLQRKGPPAVFNVQPAYVADPLAYVGTYLNQLTAAGVRAVVSVG